MTDSARRIRCVVRSQSDASPDEMPRHSASSAICSASARGGAPPSIDRRRRTSTAASQRRSWKSRGCPALAGDIQGGNRHQPASTAAVSFGSRSWSEERLATRTSSQGSMRGTAHTAMLIAPCSGSTSAGTSSSRVLRTGGVVGRSPAAKQADSGMARTMIGTSGSSTFEDCRAMPFRRARSSSFATSSSEIAKTGRGPGQYTAISEGAIASSGECIHCDPRRIDTSRAGSFSASSLRRIGIRCPDRAASGSST